MRIHSKENSADLSKATEQAETQKAREARKKLVELNAGQEGDVSGARPEISSEAKDLAKARDVALSAPDVREEKIVELRRRIQAGEYNVKPDDIADKMVEDHMRTHGIL